MYALASEGFFCSKAVIACWTSAGFAQSGTAHKAPQKIREKMYRQR
jgi:hypothetical protein